MQISLTSVWYIFIIVIWWSREEKDKISKQRQKGREREKDWAPYLKSYDLWRLNHSRAQDYQRFYHTKDLISRGTQLALLYAASFAGTRASASRRFFYHPQHYTGKMQTGTLPPRLSRGQAEFKQQTCLPRITSFSSRCHAISRNVAIVPSVISKKQINKSVSCWKKNTILPCKIQVFYLSKCRISSNCFYATYKSKAVAVCYFRLVLSKWVWDSFVITANVFASRETRLKYKQGFRGYTTCCKFTCAILRYYTRVIIDCIPFFIIQLRYILAIKVT